MNLLCKYIEGINFGISEKTKIDSESFDYSIYKRKDIEYEDYYEQVKEVIQGFLKEQRLTIVNSSKECDNDENNDENKEVQFNFSAENLINKLSKVNSNRLIIVNCLVDYFYKEKPKSNKDILWNAYGNLIYKNIVKNSGAITALFPMPSDESFDLEYLGYKYKLQEVKL